MSETAEGPATVTRTVCGHAPGEVMFGRCSACGSDVAEGPATVTPATECGCGITREHTPQECEGPATVTLTDLRPAEHASPDYKHGYGDALRDVAARVDALTRALADAIPPDMTEDNTYVSVRRLRALLPAAPTEEQP